MKKEDKQKDWIRKSKQLKDEYQSYDELRNHCIEIFGSKYNFGIEDNIEKNILMIWNYFSRHTCVYFKRVENKLIKYQLTEEELEEMTKQISKQLDNKKFTHDVLKDALRDSDHVVLKEIDKKLQDKKTKVKTKPGCMELYVGNKKIKIR